MDLVLGKIDADIDPIMEQFRLDSHLFQFWDDNLTKMSEPLKLYLASSRHTMWESNQYSKCKLFFFAAVGLLMQDTLVACFCRKKD